MAATLPERPMLPRRTPPPYATYELHAGVFSPAQCGRILALGTSLPQGSADLEGDEDSASDLAIRDARTAWIPPGSGAEWIYMKLASVAGRANRRYGFELNGFEEDLQFTTYDRPGSFYTWHQDGLDGPVAHRKLSMVVQLSDPSDYQGGELDFLPTSVDLDEAELAAFRAESGAQGTVVVFPSLEFHRVLPLRSGCRRSLVSWVSGPPFR